jgi:hypothetical protein
MGKVANGDRSGAPTGGLRKELIRAINLLGDQLIVAVEEEKIADRKRPNHKIQWRVPNDVLRQRIIPAFEGFIDLVLRNELFPPIDARTSPNPLDRLYEQANKVRNHLSGPWGRGDPLYFNVPYGKDVCVQIAIDALTFVKALTPDTFRVEYMERRRSGRWNPAREPSGSAKPAWRKAILLFDQAREGLGREPDDPPSDKAAYDWLEDQQTAGLPNQLTFSRYLRAYRRAQGLPAKRTPKRARGTSRSIERPEDR